MAEGGRSSRGRSRKRKSTRGKAVFAAVLKVILVLLIAAGLLFSSTYVYRYWEGSRTSTTPLETGREIVPETMIANARAKMPKYGLKNVGLVVQQGFGQEATDINELKSLLMQDLYKNSEEVLRAQSVQFDSL